MLFGIYVLTGRFTLEIIYTDKDDKICLCSLYSRLDVETQK